MIDDNNIYSKFKKNIFLTIILSLIDLDLSTLTNDISPSVSYSTLSGGEIYTRILLVRN